MSNTLPTGSPAQAVIAILENFGMSYLSAGLPVLVQVAIATTPGAAEDEIVSTVEGQVKHEGRQHIGWAIDLVWPFVDPYVRELIQAQYASVTAPVKAPNLANGGDNAAA